MSQVESVEQCLSGIDPEVRAILEGALAGRDLDVEQGVRLSRVSGRELHALCLVADALRREQVGELVTYVVNRNVNFTNACVKACKFCAFSRGHRSEEAYFLGDDEIVRRSLEARALGATEICIQAGLAPGMDPQLYARLCRAIKAAAPDLHIHAFSPEEVKYGAGLAKVPIRAFLEELREAGLGSLPGTSAEILDDAVRARIAPGRITTREWIEVVTSAHAVGLPTTSTIMFGHVESDVERIRHLELLRSIQRDTGGITELVPLSFVHHEAPMTLRRQVPGLREGPTGNDVVRLFAIARLMLGRDIPNLQASWVKEGMRQAQWLLSCGANDLGGTLMNESISTAAGAGNGQFQPPRALRRLARDAGREPAQRNTRYEIVRAFEQGEDPAEPLDQVTDPDQTFGTYVSLTRDERYRFQLVREGAKPNGPS
jgi:7,8-didemethyl-8-hydroxy-5-deazariboflavin synthase CofH subunit